MTKEIFIEECKNAASNFSVIPETAHIQLKALEPVFEEQFKEDQECVDAMVAAWKAEAAYIHRCFQEALSGSNTTKQEYSNGQQSKKAAYL